MSLNETATPVRARRGRPPAAEAPAPAAPVAVSGVVVADAPTDAPVAPRVRKPFGARTQKLDNSERLGYHRHWFNDKGNRIRDAQEAGYSFVLDHAGKKMTHIVGVAEAGGGGITAYRMEIPLEWYDEDQRKKVAAGEEKMNQIKHGIVAGVVPGEDGAYRPVNKSGTVGADIRIGNRK